MKLIRKINENVGALINIHYQQLDYIIIVHFEMANK